MFVSSVCGGYLYLLPVAIICAFCVWYVFALTVLLMCVTCGRLKPRVARVRVSKKRKASCGSSVEAGVKMSELGPVTEVLFSTWTLSPRDRLCAS